MVVVRVPAEYLLTHGSGQVLKKRTDEILIQNTDTEWETNLFPFKLNKRKPDNNKEIVIIGNLQTQYVLARLRGNLSVVSQGDCALSHTQDSRCLLGIEEG